MSSELVSHFSNCFTKSTFLSFLSLGVGVLDCCSLYETRSRRTRLDVGLVRFPALALTGFLFLARINSFQHARLLAFKLLILLNISFIEFNG